MPESRNYNAEYYDAITTQTADIEFYAKFLTANCHVLELGCGTGRVSLALCDKASFVGVDISNEMLVAARAKDNGRRAEFIEGDITAIDLGRKFDLVIAPFRVMQALEFDDQVNGFFRVIQKHLAEKGTAILNVFRPLYSKEEMPLKWCREGENNRAETTLANGDVLKTSDTRKKMDARNQVLHPELIHRRYREGKLIDEHINPICMRYWYADEFKALIERNGFRITGEWGGYSGEKYGEGPELILAFQKAFCFSG
jgi:ubiquinone/menaquinone biosynthesis C-methylase UbiE